MATLSAQYGDMIQDRLRYARSWCDNNTNTLSSCLRRSVDTPEWVVCSLHCVTSVTNPIPEYKESGGLIVTKAYCAPSCSDRWVARDNTAAIDVMTWSCADPPEYMIEGCVVSLLITVTRNEGITGITVHNVRHMLEYYQRKQQHVEVNGSVKSAITFAADPVDGVNGNDSYVLASNDQFVPSAQQEHATTVVVVDSSDATYHIPYCVDGWVVPATTSVLCNPCIEHVVGVGDICFLPRELIACWTSMLHKDYPVESEHVCHIGGTQGPLDRTLVAMCLHMHVAPMAPEVFPTHPFEQDPFFLISLPDLMVCATTHASSMSRYRIRGHVVTFCGVQIGTRLVIPL